MGIYKCVCVRVQTEKRERDAFTSCVYGSVYKFGLLRRGSIDSLIFFFCCVSSVLDLKNMLLRNWYCRYYVTNLISSQN